jgi:serine/threonine-protein kinase HipA
MARLMVFNALAHNRDDHAKNFAFLGDTTGWRMTPAYDLTFSSTSGRGNEHTTAFAGASKPSIKALKKVCQPFSFLKPQLYLEQTLDAFAGWAEVSKALDLDKTHSANVLRALNEVWNGL